MKEQIIKILNEFAFNEDNNFVKVISESDFPAIAEKISQLDGWVKVSERLPELGQEVLLYDDWHKEGKPGDIRVGYLKEFTTRRASEGLSYYCDWGGTEFAFNITYWMPLPELPPIPE